MTKQFNDTFGLLCQRTNVYFKKQKDKHAGLMSANSNNNVVENTNSFNNNNNYSGSNVNTPTNYKQGNLDNGEQPFFRKRNQSKIESDQTYLKLKLEYI